METLSIAAAKAPLFAASGTSAATMLEQAVAQYGPRPAMDFFGRRTSYAKLGRLVSHAAAGLQAFGVAKGVNVGLCLPNCPYYVVMYHAILKAGATVVNFNPLYTAHEIEAQSRACDVKMMVTLDLALIQDKIAPLVDKNLFEQVIVCRMAKALPPLKSLLLRSFKRRDLAEIPGQPPYVEFSDLIWGGKPFTPVAINPAEDTAVLQFTGGTTGTPKAAMLSHANITINVAQLRAVFPEVALGQERFLAVLPLFHVFAMTSIMNFGLSIGAEILLMPRLDVKEMMRIIFRCRPTILPGVPTLFTAICNAAEGMKNPDMRFIKFCISGGAPLAAETQERFERLAHTKILEGYGLSETSPVVAFNKFGATRLGGVGPAIPGTTIEIRDPANPQSLLPQGERGEICVRGPQVMQGYYHRPVETAAVFADGSLRTGDIGYLDAEGYLYIVDRIKDLIITGGYNVYPRTIEEAAYQHPAVQDAIAIGIADSYRGQVPKLFVTLRAGASATPAEILAFLATHLNKIEIPKSVEIRDSLPRTLVGKLSKKELVAEEKLRAQAG